MALWSQHSDTVMYRLRSNKNVCVQAIDFVFQNDHSIVNRAGMQHFDNPNAAASGQLAAGAVAELNGL